MNHDIDLTAAVERAAKAAFTKSQVFKDTKATWESIGTYFQYLWRDEVLPIVMAVLNDEPEEGIEPIYRNEI